MVSHGTALVRVPWDSGVGQPGRMGQLGDVGTVGQLGQVVRRLAVGGRGELSMKTLGVWDGHRLEEPFLGLVTSMS